MSKIIILGATGSLGQHVLQQAVAAGHIVTALVRTPKKLPAALLENIAVIRADLANIEVSELSKAIRGHDVVINTAGLVTQGQDFVNLINRLISSIESIPTQEQPVTWLMAGAGLLDVKWSSWSFLKGGSAHLPFQALLDPFPVSCTWVHIPSRHKPALRNGSPH